MNRTLETESGRERVRERGQQSEPFAARARFSHPSFFLKVCAAETWSEGREAGERGR